MASTTPRNVFFGSRAACLAYRGLRGDVVTSLANDFVGIVQNPAAAPCEIDTTPFVPSDNNTTDLGAPANRFRTLFLGTSIDLNGQTLREASGSYTFGPANLNCPQLTPVAVGQIAQVRTDGGADPNGSIALVPIGTGRAILMTPGGIEQVAANATGVGFFGAPPVAQPAAIPNPVGGATIDVEGRATSDAILTSLRKLGLIAT